LSKSGNARVRRGLIQLAWRFLRFQKESALAQWYRGRTEGGGRRERAGGIRHSMCRYIRVRRSVAEGLSEA
jgi:hypothetical protein